MVDEDNLPPHAEVKDGKITVLPLTEAYPNPSLNRIVMTIEDYGTAPVSGQQDIDKLKDAYWEFGSWLRQHGSDNDA